MKVKELLTDKSKWTKDALACDIDRNPVSATDIRAVSWSLLGAVYKCYPDWSEKHRVINIVKKNIYFFLDYWNDVPGRIFEDVKKLIEELDI